MKTLKHNLVLALALLVCSYAGGAFASEDGMYSLETVKACDGFTTRQPTISDYELREAVTESQRYLSKEEDALKADLNKHREAGNNIVLAAIMPGGMLYLAYHKGQQSVTEGKIETVELAQKEINTDRARLQLDRPSIIQVARNP